MEFGKVDRATLLQMFSQNKLSLPIDDPRTKSALQTSRDLRVRADLVRHHRQLPQVAARLGVGAPVWSVKEWVGQVYPAGTETKDFLTHYARQFNSVELNSTHYGIPNHETVQRWRESTPDTFRFNVKFLQTISHQMSHQNSFDKTSRLTREFVESILPLGDRLGISFLQLPPSFAPMDLPRLKIFLEQLSPELSVAVEVRHPSFFESHRLADPLYHLLQDTGAHVVITDVAGRRDVLHLSLPGPRAMVRFIGNGVDEVDEPRLDQWAQRISSWLKMGLEQLEFFIHEPEDRLVPAVAGRFIDRLNRLTDLNLACWQPVEPQSKEKVQLGFFSGDEA